MNRLAALPFAVAAVLCSGTALAQQPYPSRAVRIVVPVPPGGSVDTVSRLLGQRMSELMGQNIVIDNRPGAATNIGTELVAKSPPDGYTLLANAIPFAANPSLYPKLPWHPERDFAPVSMLATTPHIFVVHPSLPVKDIRDLVRLAKQKPGAINYSSSGGGSNLHIATELFKYLTKTNLVHVPYKGGGPAMAALLGGEVELSVPALVAVMGQVGAGKLRALALTSAARSKVVPDLPTVAEQGVAGYEFTSWVGLFAPAGTPPPVLATLHDAIVKAAQSPGMRERFDKEGADVVASSPAEFRKYIAQDVARWARVVKESGMRAE